MSLKPLWHIAFLLLLPYFAFGQTRPDFLNHHSSWTIKNCPDSLHLWNLDTMKLQNSIPFSQEGYLSFYCTIKDSNALIVGTNPYVDSTMADENGNKIPPVTIDRYFKYGHWWFDVKANTIIFYFENGKPMAYSIKDIDFNHVFLLKRKYN